MKRRNTINSFLYQQMTNHDSTLGKEQIKTRIKENKYSLLLSLSRNELQNDFLRPVSSFRRCDVQ